MKENKDLNEQFLNYRTYFWKSFTFEFLIIIVPTFLIWIFFGKFFSNESFNLYNKINSDWILVLICFGLIIICLTLNTITCFLKWQNLDSFTYTLGILFFLVSYIILELWTLDWQISHYFFKMLIIFIIMFISSIVGLLIGTMISTILKNKIN